MTSTTTRQITFEEFEQMPEQAGKQELLRGELIELPPAKRKHNAIADRILFTFAKILDTLKTNGEGGPFGAVHREMGYRFPDNTWLQPDVSITHQNQGGEDYYLDAPALALEVVSEGNTAAHLDGKVAEYLAGGALEVWVLYPKKQHIWVYRAGGTAEVHSGVFESRIFAGARIDVASFLAD